MPRNLNSSLMKPFVVLAIPGMYLFCKYNQYKRQRQEQNRRKVTERELAHLNHKIDKLLTKLDEHEPELATSQEEGCAICITARATMQTFPCGHRVVCRKCFVKTIQTAVAQRMLPLRCVICRTKILRLKQSGVSPSPSEASSLSAFSACSSSFSLASFKTIDSTSRPSSCASARSAPPLLLYHHHAAAAATSPTSLRPRSCSPPSSPHRTAAAASATAGKGTTPNNNNNANKHAHLYHPSTSSSSSSSSSQVVNNNNNNNNELIKSNGLTLNNNNNYTCISSSSSPRVSSKEKPISNRYKSRSSPKLQSLPKVTVRSRSPHKLQLHMHRLEIIKEVE